MIFSPYEESAANLLRQLRVPELTESKNAFAACALKLLSFDKLVHCLVTEVPSKTAADWLCMRDTKSHIDYQIEFYQATFRQTEPSEKGRRNDSFNPESNVNASNSSELTHVLKLSS